MTALRQPSTPLADAARFRAPAHVDNVIERRRLLDVLREGDRRLTVIHAPAGYGKTTLVVQWLHELSGEGATVAWLGLHRDDNDPHWFLSHLLAAVARALPGAKDDLRDLAQLIEENAEDTQTYALSVLLDRVGRHAGRFVLTFDDWHVIDDPVVHQGLVQLLDFAPPNLLLILTSRTRPQLPLSRLRVRRQLTEVDADGLRFDAAETRAFLVDLNGLDLDGADVARLSVSTDGWAAALQLASLSLRDCADPAELIRGFSGRHHAIEEYLAENVLGALPADVLDFLLVTSVSDRLCGDLAGALSGRTDGQAMLEELERRDLFLRPLDTERTWFRYHHMFAEQLRRRLSRDRPGAEAGLHLRASAWFADQDLVPEAVTHALAAGDLSAATDLVERCAMPLVEHSRMVSLLGLLGRLPADAADGRPGLLMAVAWANCLLQRTSAAQFALDKLREADLSEEACSEADVVQACIDVYGDRTDRAEELVARSLQRAAHYRPWIVAVAANIQSFCDIHAARYQDARDRQRWARAFQARTSGPFSGVYGRCFAGMAALAQLDLDGAQEQLLDAVSLARTSAGRRSHAARLAGALLGELLYERGELQEAERLLEESRELGAESGVVDFMIDSYGLLARIRARRGAVPEAAELLGDGVQAAERLRLPRLAAALQAERVTLLIRERRVQEARRVAQELPDGQRCHAGIGVAIHQLRTASWAAVLSAEGDHAAAAALLDGLVAELHARGQGRAEVAAMVQLSVVDERAARWRAAERALAAALERALPAGLWQSVLDADVGPVLDRLLAQARADTWPAGLAALPVERLHALAAAHGRQTQAVSRAEHPTGREVDVLRMLAAGRSNQQIAQSLTITVNTVKWYLKNINVKLGAANRTEAVSLARRKGLVN